MRDPELRSAENLLDVSRGKGRRLSLTVQLTWVRDVRVAADEAEPHVVDSLPTPSPLSPTASRTEP